MNKKKNIWIPCLLVAIALGNAWAIRGKFGHEQGAAWAGAIGALALVLVSKRSDWYQKVFSVALAAAFGWGMGGMISYGVVVGYGRGSDFLNVSYGLIMLFVIGALYGFTGGGMVGLALANTDKLKIKWSQLLTEMIGIGILTYALLIMQLEWFMTPPRSEMWAACFGASIALIWYAIRLEQWAVVSVSIWSAIGSGFGFAFGNVLQVLGNDRGIPINLWNVMEYSIGFCGGLGMAYGVFTNAWPVAQEARTRYGNIIPIILIVIVIPYLVWQQSFTTEKLMSLLEHGGTPGWIHVAISIALLLIALMSYYILKQDRSIVNMNHSYSYITVRNIFIIYLSVFAILSFLVTGVYSHPVEQYLYIINLIVFLIYAPAAKIEIHNVNYEVRKQFLSLVIALGILLLSAFIMINSHGVVKGAQVRFP